MQSTARALLVVAAFGITVGTAMFLPGAKTPDGPGISPTPDPAQDFRAPQSPTLDRLQPAASGRVALMQELDAFAQAQAPSGNPDLAPGQCEHFVTLIARTPMKWHSSDWSMALSPNEESPLPRPFASTIDTEDPYACTLGIGAASGRYLVRQRSSLWETEVALHCESGGQRPSDLVMPPTWPLNVHVLDSTGESVGDVHVSVMRGALSESFSTAARKQPDGRYAANVVAGTFTVVVQGAAKQPIMQEVEVANGPADVIVDVPSGDRFEVSVVFKRNGETVKVTRQELRALEALDASHNDALIASGGRMRAQRSSRSEIENMNRAIKTGDHATVRSYLSGYEVVTLVLESTDEVTVRALGLDFQVDPSRAGSLIEVNVP